MGAICRSTLTATDLRVVEHIASDRTSGEITLAHAFSWIGSGYVVFPLTLICFAILYVRGWRWWSLAIAVSAFGATLITNGDKVLVGRTRPPVRHLEGVNGQSFPSGHTAHTAAFCMALVLALAAADPPRWAQISATVAGVLLVLCVAASRVFLGVHYPSDVVAGALLGTTWALVACRSAQTNRRETHNGRASTEGANHAMRVTTSHPVGTQAEVDDSTAHAIDAEEFAARSTASEQ